MPPSEVQAGLCVDDTTSAVADDLVARLVEEMSDAAVVGRKTERMPVDPALALVERRLEQLRRGAVTPEPVAPKRPSQPSVAPPVPAIARGRSPASPAPVPYVAPPASIPPAPVPPAAARSRPKPHSPEAVIAEAAAVMGYELAYHPATPRRRPPVRSRRHADPAASTLLRRVLFLAVLAAAILVPDGGPETRAPEVALFETQAVPDVSEVSEVSEVSKEAAALPLTRRNLRLVRTVPVGADGRVPDMGAR